MAVLVHIKSVTLVSLKICDTFPSMMHHATYDSRFLKETELVNMLFSSLLEWLLQATIYVGATCHPKISALLLNHSQCLMMLTNTSWLHILFT